jgi:hypothetical protein
VLSIDTAKEDIIISSNGCFTMKDEHVKSLKNMNISEEDKISGLWGKLFIEFTVEKK